MKENTMKPHETNTDNPIDFPEEAVLEEKTQIEKPSEATTEEAKPLSKLKQERAAKAERKKAVKSLTERFGSAKLAKRMVKTAIKNINTRRASGRGR